MPKAWILSVLVLPLVPVPSTPIAPPESLVADGVPPIPSALAAEVSRYTKGRTAELLAWHPTKREMLIATFFGDIPEVHLVKGPGAARTQLTFFDDRPTRGVSYQPTRGDFFLFDKDAGGDQNFQIYRYDFATAAVTLLTDGKSRNSAALWSHAGDRIVYTSNRRTGKDSDLYVMDPRDPKTDRMLVPVEGGGWRALDWSPDGREIVVQQTTSINESSLWLVDARSGEKTLVTPKGGEPPKEGEPPQGGKQVSYSDARFQRDGKRLYVVTDRGSEFVRVGSLDLASRRYEPFTGRIPWDVFEFEPSPDGRTLAIVANEDGVTKVHLFDAATGRERPIRQMPAGEAIGIHWRNNGRELGFSLDSAKSPTDAYSLDVATGRVDRWTFSETGLDTSGFVEPELVRWKSFDDRTISGFLYRPPARFKGKRPVIVDVHGGPEAQFQPYYLGQQNYYPNELGTALLYPNIRGSSGYGKSFLKLDDGLTREDAYRDLGSLLDWIKTRPDLDADRVMVTGASYGGHMALVVAVRYADRIRCAVDIVGPSSLVTFLEHTAGYRQDLRRVEYGDERDPEVRAFLERTAPLGQASKITKPLLVVQGNNDPIVPTTEAEQIVKAVKANGVPVWYLLAKDEGHGFYKKPNSDYQLYATVTFVRECLLN